MKTITIIKTDRNLVGSIRLPSSKSISNRLLIIQALASTDFDIAHLSDSDDTLLLQDLLQKIREHKGRTLMAELDTSNAGTVMRFLTVDGRT